MRRTWVSRWRFETTHAQTLPLTSTPTSATTTTASTSTTLVSKSKKTNNNNTDTPKSNRLKRSTSTATPTSTATNTSRSIFRPFFSPSTSIVTTPRDYNDARVEALANFHALATQHGIDDLRWSDYILAISVYIALIDRAARQRQHYETFRSQTLPSRLKWPNTSRRQRRFRYIAASVHTIPPDSPPSWSPQSSPSQSPRQSLDMEGEQPQLTRLKKSSTVHNVNATLTTTTCPLSTNSTNSSTTTLIESSTRTSATATKINRVMHVKFALDMNTAITNSTSTNVTNDTHVNQLTDNTITDDVDENISPLSSHPSLSQSQSQSQPQLQSQQGRRKRRRQSQHRRNRSLPADVPYVLSSSFSSSLLSPSSSASTNSFLSPSPSPSPSPSVSINSTSSVSSSSYLRPRHLQLLYHMLRHAESVYGLPLTVASAPGISLTRVTDRAIICRRTGVKPDDLLMAQFSAQPFLPAFYVAIDHAAHAVVVCVRGTAKFADSLTDVAATHDALRVLKDPRHSRTRLTRPDISLSSLSMASSSSGCISVNAAAAAAAAGRMKLNNNYNNNDNRPKRSSTMPSFLVNSSQKITGKMEEENDEIHDNMNSSTTTKTSNSKKDVAVEQLEREHGNNHGSDRLGGAYFKISKSVSNETGVKFKHNYSTIDFNNIVKKDSETTTNTTTDDDDDDDDDEHFVNGFGHSGIVRSANNLLHKVQDTVLCAMSKHPNYTIVTTGHSLGAATASVLALLLRRDIENVSCVAFAPPPCVTYDVAEAAETCTLSLVNGADIVPRLSVAVLLPLFATARYVADLPRHKKSLVGLGLKRMAVKWEELRAMTARKIGQMDQIHEGKRLFLPGRVFHATRKLTKRNHDNNNNNSNSKQNENEFISKNNNNDETRLFVDGDEDNVASERGRRSNRKGDGENEEVEVEGEEVYIDDDDDDVDVLMNWNWTEMRKKICRNMVTAASRGKLSEAQVKRVSRTNFLHVKARQKGMLTAHAPFSYRAVLAQAMRKYGKVPVPIEGVGNVMRQLMADDKGAVQVWAELCGGHDAHVNKGGGKTKKNLEKGS